MLRRAAIRNSGVRQALVSLSAAVAFETALTIGHFVYGAHVYDDASRLHVVMPAIASLSVALFFAGLYAWRRQRLTLWVLVVTVAIPFVGLFGLYHGGFNHGLKLVMYAFGMPPERLEEIFDSPDFAQPSDVAFEATGVATLLAAAVVAFFLARLVRSSSPARSATGEGAT